VIEDSTHAMLDRPDTPYARMWRAAEPAEVHDGRAYEPA
jgi:hypothetical protein